MMTPEEKAEKKHAEEKAARRAKRHQQSLLDAQARIAERKSKLAGKIAAQVDAKTLRAAVRRNAEFLKNERAKPEKWTEGFDMHTIPTETLTTFWAKMWKCDVAGLLGGRPKELKQCPIARCKEKFGARDMRKHLRDAHNLHFSQVRATQPQYGEKGYSKYNPVRPTLY